MSETTIVIVSFNSAHLLEERLKAYSGYPVVVVDNASSDGTAEWIDSSFPEVRLVTSPVNGGYGRAANMGFERVATRFALLANPDAKIEKESIDRLEAEAHRLDREWLFIAPNTGMAPERSGSSMGPGADAPAPDAGNLERVASASGAALFIQMETLREIGGFDPNIFLFFEETDLCRRARTRGLAMYYASEITVAHELGTSTHSSDSIEYMRKWHYNWSRLYYYRKHRLWMPYARTVWKNLVMAGIKLRGLKRGSDRHAMNEARHASARAFLAGRSAFRSSGGPCDESLSRT